MEIDTVWQHRGQLIFKFRGIDSISEAEAVEGAEVRIPRALRADLPEGEYYESDLAGCAVVDSASGEPIGIVRGVEEFGGPPLLAIEVAGAREPLLVPFVKAICREIDVAGRRIVVDLPEGLKDI